ncbi:unnamed protein product [Owenia fusiformis]|uniref:LicD/FKTN/FKRP nucleotidyltransferase domain-containing protein n=1 Tax=Owenia fusiformis TaxID=6347 RepID=A0A8S4Q2W7_OWEFU|nr:unnamed protein product [Owenia fusiformis]
MRIRHFTIKLIFSIIVVYALGILILYRRKKLEAIRICELRNREMFPKDKWGTSLNRPLGTKAYRANDIHNKLTVLDIPNADQFLPAIEDHNYYIMMNILRKFVDVCQNNSLDYFMCGGTLLGAYRHHGFIPWDDDLDVMMNVSQMPQIKAIFGSLGPDYVLQAPNGILQWKLFSKNSCNIMSKDFKWPYLDIFFYEELNKTHIRDSIVYYAKEVFHKSKVWPLQKRKFENMEINAPCDTATFLDTHYDVSLCMSKDYNHAKEVFTNKATAISCDVLHHIYPFVKRAKYNDHVKESLMLGNITLEIVNLPKTC